MAASLQRDLKVELIDEARVFLMTTPLVKGMKESEIEDLLPTEVLDMKIEGRTFDRSGKKDLKSFYNKDVLSRHVYKMYESIDLSIFRQILNTLDAIVAGANPTACVGV